MPLETGPVRQRVPNPFQRRQTAGYELYNLSRHLKPLPSLSSLEEIWWQQGAKENRPNEADTSVNSAVCQMRTVGILILQSTLEQ